MSLLHRASLQLQAGTATQNLSRSLLVFGTLTAVATLWWMLGLARYGIDFTDEGLYFNVISNPWLYSWSTTQYGFVYYLLYELVGEDVARLRQANMLLSLGLGWGVVWLLLRRAYSGRLVGEGRWLLAALALALAVPALYILMIWGRWVATPSYNTLNFHGYLVAAMGLLLLDPARRRSLWLGAALLGLGGALSFLAKPPSAAVLGVLVLVSLATLGLWRWRILLGAIASALLTLLLAAWLIDGSVGAFVQRMADGLQALQLMKTEHASLANMLRLDAIGWTPGLKLNVELLALFTGLGVYWSARSSGKAQSIVLVVTAMLLFAVAYAALGGGNPALGRLGRFHALQAWGVWFGLLAAAVALSLRTNLFSRQGVAIALLFTLMPYAFAIGTNNNYWGTGMGAGLFWVLGGLALLLFGRQGPLPWQVLLPVIAAVQLVSVIVLATATTYPYRQHHALQQSAHRVQDLRGENPLLVSEPVGQYLDALQAQARQAGFTPDTPLIDMTGHNPAVVFYLSGKAIGQGWMIGGYKGSNDLAHYALGRVACEQIARAWVLADPQGARALSSELLKPHGARLPASIRANVSLDSGLLKQHGANIDADYTVAATAHLELPPGGRWGGMAKDRTHTLLKPKRTLEEGIQSCEVARRKHPQ